MFTSINKPCLMKLSRNRDLTNYLEKLSVADLSITYAKRFLLPHFPQQKTFLQKITSLLNCYIATH